MRMGTMRMGMQTVYKLALSATIFTVLFTCGVLHPSTATATTYYVATTGNDANPGTQAQPFRTVAKGLSSLTAGDTLYLRGGTYSEGLNSNYQTIPTGTSWSNTVRIASAPGETAILKPNSGQVLNLTAAYIQYIIFENLVIDATFANEAVSLLYLHHVRFTGGELRNSIHQGFHAAAGAHHIEVLNMKVHHNGTNAFFDHGFYYSDVDDVLIEGCEIYNNQGYGVHFYNGGGTRGNRNIVRNNRIYSNGISSGAGGLTFGDQNDALMYNNLVYNNYKGMDVNKNVNNTKVYNNTFYNNSPSAGIEVSSSSTGAIIKNNIVYQNGSAIIDNGIGTVMLNNLTTDPKFVAPSTANFLLQSTSQAIDAGIALSEISADYDGIPRPQGSSYDIGAYEYHVSSQVPTPKNLKIISTAP